ncbi:GRIP domain-containing protein [Linnemannia elongata]|nr:GRIP domain-containing protein [Linnemannia elongata]
MREGHLRTMNKTLKEEVRKLQKQVPGSPSSQAGPFTPGGPFPQTPGHPGSAVPPPQTSAVGGATPAAGARGGRAGAMSPQSTPPSTPNFGRMLQQPEDDVNVEYLKNVLLNFMEHKERRQQLVPVVAQVLKLTPDETKRLSRGA